MSAVNAILEQVRGGELSIEAAALALAQAYTLDLGHSTLDLHRRARTGRAEVIYGAGKTPDQLVDIFRALVERERDVLATRVSAEAAAVVMARVPAAVHDPVSRTIRYHCEPPALVSSRIAVVSAGTSDSQVAEEAAVTAEFYGNPVLRIRDVGVAGLHRLLARLDEIREARVVIVVAGMEGALPSVVGGLVAVPVIAVPTSVGYGASFGGISALLGMLNSCASGVTVVNIDNGYGAGVAASLINRN